MFSFSFGLWVTKVEQLPKLVIYLGAYAIG
ncbi:Uncharacterised protein [Sphingobacterium daejeonense]|nr:Uncharacterised protein [Sphingobacterium daejeonense]